jgi:hypothetical protein
MTRTRRILGTICDHCPLCNYAREHTDSLVAQYYDWHGKWCPAWQAQREIQNERDAAKQHAQKPAMT